MSLIIIVLNKKNVKYQYIERGNIISALILSALILFVISGLIKLWYY